MVLKSFLDLLLTLLKFPNTAVLVTCLFFNYIM